MTSTQKKAAPASTTSKAQMRVPPPAPPPGGIVPESFHPPGVPAAAPSHPPHAPRSGPPDLRIQSFHPPTVAARTSADSLAFALAVEQARHLVNRADPPEPKIPDPVTDTGIGGDGLPTYQGNKQLLRWSRDVRVLVLVTQIMSKLVFEGDQTNSQASLAVRAGAGQIPLADITRPNSATLLNLDPTGKGIGKVFKRKEGRTDQAAAIVSQDLELDMVFMAALGLSADTAPRCYELALITIEVAGAIVQLFKDHLVVPRPYELAQNVDPVAALPGHASFPGGHAVQMVALAEVFGKVAAGRLNALGNGLPELARWVAENREVAGLHYPVDTEAGLALGKAAGEMMVALACGTAWSALVFKADGRQVLEPADDAVEALPKLKLLWETAFMEANPKP